mmetsp:Transcript_51346/g.107232  ORF Transcript_51346/g.107232 Transcript_51346/m.107232 type:complete len:200 (-) Transcript_51346:113-712(-)
MRKLSGLTSRCRKPLLCTYSRRDSICSPTMSTVFRPNRRLQKLKRSSREGPRRSMTMMLLSPSVPAHVISGMPCPPRMCRSTFASYNNCGCCVRTGSILTATSSPVETCEARKISPNEPDPNFLLILYFLFALSCPSIEDELGAEEMEELAPAAWPLDCIGAAIKRESRNCHFRKNATRKISTDICQEILSKFLSRVVS